MNAKDVIDYNDKSLYEDDGLTLSPEEKEFYSPEEAYELVMSDIQSIYSLKYAV